MLFSIEDLKLSDTGSYTLVHIGASNCQEAPYYNACQFKSVIWIEALEHIYMQAQSIIKDLPGQKVYRYLLSDRENEYVDFFEASNNGESSSLLRPFLHRRIHKSVDFANIKSMKTTTLDSVLLEHADSCDRFILVLDVQGAEKMVLDGADKILQRVDAIFTEISAIHLYRNQILFPELNNSISKLGFTLAKHDLSMNNPYGDALYVRGEIDPFQTQESILHLCRLLNLRFSVPGIFLNRILGKAKSFFQIKV